MAARDDIELMQLADGELDDRVASQINARTEREPEARAKVIALTQNSELVRSHLELAADDVPPARFDAMWRTIGKEIASADEAAPAGVWGKITAWLERHRGHLLTGAVSAGAVATLALILRPAAPEGGGLATTNPTAIDVRPAALRAAPAIESLDTPGGTGTVINLVDEDGHTAVIWVTAEDTVEGI
jgi:anti-sigma factor RsiW